MPTDTTALSDERAPIDMIHDGARVVTILSHDLLNIARCLHRVGLSTLADELSEISRDLEKASKDIRSGYSLDLTQQFRRSEEATSNLLHAALAGLKVAKDSSQ